MKYLYYYPALSDGWDVYDSTTHADLTGLHDCDRPPLGTTGWDQESRRPVAEEPGGHLLFWLAVLPSELYTSTHGVQERGRLRAKKVSPESTHYTARSSEDLSRSTICSVLRKV